MFIMDGYSVYEGENPFVGREGVGNYIAGVARSKPEGFNLICKNRSFSDVDDLFFYGGVSTFDYLGDFGNNLAGLIFRYNPTNNTYYSLLIQEVDGDVRFILKYDSSTAYMDGNVIGTYTYTGNVINSFVVILLRRSIPQIHIYVNEALSPQGVIFLNGAGVPQYPTGLHGFFSGGRFDMTGFKIRDPMWSDSLIQPVQIQNLDPQHLSQGVDIDKTLELTFNQPAISWKSSSEFNDNHDDWILFGWVVRAGKIAWLEDSSSGVYRENITIPEDGQSFLINDFPTSTDGVCKVKLNLSLTDAPFTTHQSSLIFRYRDRDNFYGVGVMKGGQYTNDHIKIYKNSLENIVASFHLPDHQTGVGMIPQYVELRVTISGTSYQIESRFSTSTDSEVNYTAWATVTTYNDSDNIFGRIGYGSRGFNGEKYARFRSIEWQDTLPREEGIQIKRFSDNSLFQHLPIPSEDVNLFTRKRLNEFITSQEDWSAQSSPNGNDPSITFNPSVRYNNGGSLQVVTQAGATTNSTVRYREDYLDFSNFDKLTVRVRTTQTANFAAALWWGDGVFNFIHGNIIEITDGDGWVELSVSLDGVGDKTFIRAYGVRCFNTGVTFNVDYVVLESGVSNKLIVSPNQFEEDETYYVEIDGLTVNGQVGTVWSGIGGVNDWRFSTTPINKAFVPIHIFRRGGL